MKKVLILFLAFSLLPLIMPNVLFAQQRNTNNIVVENNIDRPGKDYERIVLEKPDLNLCIEACKKDPKCKAFTYVKPGVQGPKAVCYLKNEFPNPVKNTNCISGIKQKIDLIKGKKIEPQPKIKDKKIVKTLPVSVPKPRSRDLERKKFDQFNSIWKSELQKYLSNEGYGDLIKLQDRLFNQELDQAKYNFNSNIVAKKPKANFKQVKIKNLAEQELSKVLATKKVTIAGDPTSLILKPEITQIIPVPQQAWVDMIQLGGFVFIKGKKFGKEHGKVALKYQEEAKEFNQPPAPKFIHLTPYEGDWNRAWMDDIIIMEIPSDLPSNNYVSPKGELIVYKEGTGHYKITHPVSINFAGPTIHNIIASPKYGDGKNKNCAVSGGVLRLEGKHLGDQPGRVYLSLSEPINGKNELELNILHWYDIGILVQIPKINNLQGYQPTLINVERKSESSTKKLWASSIRFGPRLLVTNISGIDFLELDKKHSNDNAEEHLGIGSIVHHTDDCTWTNAYQGANVGYDYFFRNKPLPSGAEVIVCYYDLVNPDDILETLKKLGEQFIDLFEAFTGGPESTLQYIAESLGSIVAGYVNPNVGEYSAVVEKYPEKNDPSVNVHWHTTCYPRSQMQGEPVRYLISFTIRGPEDFIRSIAETPFPEIIPSLSANNLYHIKHKYSNKYVCAGATNNGGNVHQWGPIPIEHETRYQFQPVDAGGGYYYLVHQYSGKMLCAYDTFNGANVFLWGPIQKGEQDKYKFKLEKVENDYYKILHKNSGKYLYNGDLQNGGNMTLWGTNSNISDDKFLFELETYNLY